jgi:N-acetylmuramoyl-L-alanine amidase
MKPRSPASTRRVKGKGKKKEKKAPPPAMEGDQALLPLQGEPPKRLPTVERILPEEPTPPRDPHFSNASRGEMSGEVLLPLETTTPARKSEPVLKRPVTDPPVRRVGVWQKLRKVLSMEHVTPTVGLMTLAGCLTFLIAPNEDPGADARVAAALNPGLPIVVVDPGHGGRDRGASANELVEKDLTLDLAFRAERLLQTYGFKTVLTRRDDSFMSLMDRAEIANKYDRAIFVSLHFNQSQSSAAAGIETYYASQKVLPEPQWTWAGFFSKAQPNEIADTGENLAGYVQAALVSRTDGGNRGIKPKALYVVRHTRVPAILVEGGFISNLFEARLIATPEYRDRLAAAVVEGVIQYSNTLPRPGQEPTQLAKASP